MTEDDGYQLLGIINKHDVLVQTIHTQRSAESVANDWPGHTVAEASTWSPENVALYRSWTLRKVPSGPAL